MKKIPWILFAGGLLAGLLLYFPFHIFTSTLERRILQQTGLEVHLGDMRVSSGLKLGLLNGGLFALRGNNVSIHFQSGRSLVCKEFWVSPQLWPIFLAQGRAAIACQTERDGSVLAVLSAGPLWNPSRMSGNITVKDLQLRVLENLAPVDGLEGQLKARVRFELPITAGVRIPQVEWDAQAQEVILPPISSDFLNIPSMAVGNLRSRGQLSNTGKAQIEELTIGQAASPIELSLHGSLTLDRRGFPTAADLTGRLKTDPDFEKNQLRDVSLDLLFGKADSSGVRNFHKTAQGSLLGLLMSPPLDKAP